MYMQSADLQIHNPHFTVGMFNVLLIIGSDQWSDCKVQKNW